MNAIGQNHVNCCTDTHTRPTVETVWEKSRFFKQKLGFRFLKIFLGFNLLQMPDTKLRPTSTMKSKDKSSEQRFGHVNATNRNSYLNIIFC